LNLFTGVPALLRTITEFSLGALLYRSQLAAKSASGILPALLAVVCVVFAALTRWDIATVGVLACLVFYGANPTSFLARLLNSAPAIAVGAWSYSIFLWHRTGALRCHGDVFSVWSPDPDSERDRRKIVDDGNHAGRSMPIGPDFQLLRVRLAFRSPP
jgi:hypothetical protein